MDRNKQVVKRKQEKLHKRSHVKNGVKLEPDTEEEYRKINALLRKKHVEYYTFAHAIEGNTIQDKKREGAEKLRKSKLQSKR